jgi:serine/threonine protein kinase
MGCVHGSCRSISGSEKLRASQEKAIRLSELCVDDDVIAVSSTGMVRIAVQLKTNRRFALKSTFKSALTGERARLQAVRERLALQGVFDSPFCVSLVDAFRTPRSVHLLMEYLPGGELFERIHAVHRMREREAAFYIASMVLALEHLHGHGYIHRDIKPENIMFSADGNVKLVDMGFAKRIGGSRTYTLCGTADYMAPEVVLGTGTSFAADVWSLGALLYEMLSIPRCPPFSPGVGCGARVGSASATYAAICNGGFKKLDKRVSRAARDLVARMLVVDPTLRITLGEIRRHAWMAWVDWDELNELRVPPPYVPRARVARARNPRSSMRMGAADVRCSLDSDADDSDERAGVDEAFADGWRPSQGVSRTT